MPFLIRKKRKLSFTMLCVFVFSVVQGGTWATFKDLNALSPGSAPAC